MLIIILTIVVLAFALAYRYYGSWLERHFDIDDRRPTPSHSDYDGADRVPAKTAILLGHHFSSIAGAGPIVGPIIAASAFGWLPALLWIVFGTILFGGVHDFSSLVASIRHRAKSVAEIAREYMSPLSYRLFLLFIWLAMCYILVVFIDLTATTFVERGEVATSSALFILLAVLFGTTMYRLRVSLVVASLVFVPLVFAAVALGHLLPINTDRLPVFISSDPGRFWSLMLIAYAFFAAVLPVWILLQPRDYLSSWLLYASVAAAFIGIAFGGFNVSYPAFTTWSDIDRGTLFPILFITVACGAISGFHSIVASGTTSKQLDRESDARRIGYGAMLIEGVVAVIALFTLAMLAKGDPMSTQAPLAVYGNGLGRFGEVFGLPFEYGRSFGILAVSTFLLTTLDTSTRLARYILEELFNWKGKIAGMLASALTLLMPALFSLITLYDSQGNPVPAWRAVWPVFGATNQLLAGLALLVVFVWLRKLGKSTFFIAVPMIFMLVMTIWALIQLIYQSGFNVIGVVSFFLLVLALILVLEAFRTAVLKTRIALPS
jgi:carbon starvation protein